MIRFRKLLLLGLLSCFILLGNSFVNAVACNEVSQIYIGDIHTVGGTFPSVYDNSFNVGVLSKGTFLSQSLGYGKKIFSPTSSRLFWWGSDGLPYLYFDDGYQGVPYYYHICDEITDSTPIGNLNCSTQVYDTGAREIVKNFMSTVNNNDNWGYYMYSNYAYRTFSICISSHEVGKSVCFYGYTCSYNSTCPARNCLLVNTKSYQGLTFSNLSNSDIGESPGLDGGNSSGPGIDSIPENGFPNTNRGVFDAYAEQGYVLSRCYSDFSLDNLATATGGIYQFYETELDDGVYYTGATVLDLFVEYGYGNSFESFFDYWYQTYNQSLVNESPLKYVGLSKGLWNMSNKYYYAGLSNKYVDYTKFYNYCSYFVNFDGDWDAEYTGPQLSNDVANQLAPSQSAIDYLSGFIHSQNSGSSQNFDADTFFTSLTTKFDRLLNNINGSFVGIIPGYILAIMMALIFIRIISH